MHVYLNNTSEGGEPNVHTENCGLLSALLTLGSCTGFHRGYFPSQWFSVFRSNLALDTKALQQVTEMGYGSNFMLLDIVHLHMHRNNHA